MRVLATASFFVAVAPLLALVLLGQASLAPLLHNPVWVAALLRTLLIGEAAVPIGLLLGVPAALAVWDATLRIRRSVIAICALPILVPPAWSASGLQYVADHAGIADAHVVALIAAHAVPAASLAFLIVYGFISFADPAMLGAASESSAGTLRAWQIAVLPHVTVAIVVAAAAAFAASVGLTIVDAALASAFHSTLGAMFTVALRTGDLQTAPAALVVALLALAPLGVVWCILKLRRH